MVTNISNDKTSTSPMIDIIDDAFERNGQTVEINGIYHKTNCVGPNHAHGDNHPSLSYWEVEDDNGKPSIAFNCWSGQCSRTDILQALKIDTRTIPGAPSMNYARRPILTLAGLEKRLLMKKSNKIRKAQEQAEKQTREIEAEAKALIDREAGLTIEVHHYTSEYTGKPYQSYELHDEQRDTSIYNIEEEFLVDEVQEYIDSLKTTTK